MDVAGSFIVPADRSRVWTLITDPAVMARCIPGCQGIEVLSPTSYKASVRVSLGVLKMTFNVVVDVVEQAYPAFIVSTTKGEEGSRASIIMARNRLDLDVVDDATTQVHYASTVNLTGRLGKFGLGMMRKKADSTAAEFVATFTALSASPLEIGSA